MPMDGASHHMCKSVCTIWAPSRVLQACNVANVTDKWCFRPCLRVQHPPCSSLRELPNIALGCAQEHKSSLRLKSLSRKHAPESIVSQFVYLLPTCNVADMFHRRKKLKTLAHKYESDNDLHAQGFSHVEFEILKFMESSDTPNLFPTKIDLLRAGRADLVKNIVAKGGWLVAGWDSEPDNAPVAEESMLLVQGIEKETSYEVVGDINSKEVVNLCIDASQNTGKALTDDFKEKQGKTVALSNLGLRSQESDPVHDFSRAADRKRAWEKVADLFGLTHSKKTENGGKSSVVGCRHTSHRAATSSNFALEENVSSPTDESNEQLPSSKQLSEGKQSSDASRYALRKQKKKKKKKSSEESSKLEFNLHQTFDRINEKVNRRNDWITKAKSGAKEKPSGVQRKSNMAPISSRIHGLETELLATLDMLQFGRHVLAQHDDLKQVQAPDVALGELERLSDALEFRETELMHTRKELRTARAQLAALEGKIALELIEARKNVEEKDRKLEESMKALKSMRTARIVWSNPGSEVLLAGSFDGWISRRKMEKSSAGVFVASVQLYPGCYEIKFIVNGEWRVDPNRPIVRANGFENNLLTVL